jgi:hypothetical protein
MEHQLRRGIYRPNAQGLSISLAPLVARRSLMFRVNTDLATKASYSELTPTEESPTLYTCSPQIISAVLTAMSSASVYSQDSWKNASPSIPVVYVNPRKMVVAFSPSVEWSGIAERDDDKESISVPSVSISPPDGSSSTISEPNDTKSHSKLDVMPPLANNAVRESVRSPLDVGLPNTFGNRLSRMKSKSKKIDQQSPKRSKSSEALRKVMARLSFQPSKRKLPHLQRVDPVTISDDCQPLDCKQSEFRVPSNRHSFLV